MSDSEHSALWTWPERRTRGLAALFLLVLLAYSAGAKTALLIIDMSGLQGVFFIPAGVTVALLVRLPRRQWWIVLAAALVGELILDVTGGFPIAASLGYAAANVAEPLLGATIVVVMCGGCDLTRRRDVLWFTVGAVLAGPALGAAVGATVDRLLAGDDLLVTFAQWWIGDALGVVLVGGAILAWSSGPDRRPIFSPWGRVLLASAIAGTVIVLISTDLPLVFTVLIVVVLAGALFGVRGVAATAIAVTLTIAVLTTMDPGDLAARLTEGAALIVLKLQIGLFTLAGLLVAAESHEREVATRQAAEIAIDKQSAEREQRYHRELAVQLQRGLLPDRLVEHPELEIAARYEAAGDLLEVGGDWYDAISLGDDRIGLVVGDIVGHGTQAMISMGRLRTALRSLAVRAKHPGELVREVDAFVGGPDGTEYATLFYAIVDLRRHVIEYASAAHPPSLLVRPSGETVWLDRAQSGPLYGEHFPERRHASTTFEPGAILILYSDGLIERRNESLDAGLERLEALGRGLADRDVEEICEELFDRLGLGYSRVDDAVALVVRATTGPSTEFRESFPASSTELRNIRASVRSWAESWHLAPELTDDILIAISEAAANSVRHAYGETEQGMVEVTIQRRDGLLEIAVADEGIWKGSLDNAGHPGMGRSLIESVTENFETDIRKGGTLVTFEVPLRKPL